MTREEAKTYLDVIWNRYRAEYEIEKETMEAYHMAIEALDRQKGEWKDIPIGNIKQCSNCRYICTPILTDQTENIYNFCPNCGADMRGDR